MKTINLILKMGFTVRIPDGIETKEEYEWAIDNAIDDIDNCLPADGKICCWDIQLDEMESTSFKEYKED